MKHNLSFGSVLSLPPEMWGTGLKPLPLRMERNNGTGLLHAQINSPARELPVSTLRLLFLLL